MTFRIVLLLLFPFQIYGQLLPGLVKEDGEYLTLERTFPEKNTLPHQYSLYQYSPKAGNQLKLQTSAGWATGYYGATILVADQKRWSDKDFITRNSFSPIYNYAEVNKFNDCENPVSLIKVLEHLKSNGLPKFLDFLEFCPEEVTAEAKSKALQHNFFNYHKLFELNDPAPLKINSIKYSIYIDRPVIAAMHVPQSFASANDFWVPKEHFSNELPLHAICMLGFDDEKFGGSFQIINSWGGDWGDEGVSWVRYDDLIPFLRYGFGLSIDNLKYTGIKSEFAGSIEFYTDDSQKLEFIKKGHWLSLSEPIAHQKQFAMNVKVFQDAYFYLLHSDISGEITSVYPDKTWISPRINFKNVALTIPSNDTYYFLDESSKEDCFVFLFSRKELDIDTILKKARESDGDTWSRLKNVMGNLAIDPLKIEWSEEYSMFNITENGKEYFPILVKVPSATY